MYPSIPEKSRANIITKNILRLIFILFIIVVVKEDRTEKIIITITSIITVTPRTVWVKGPFALISLMMAMADDGDLAIKIEPASKDTTNFSEKFMLLMNGI